MSECDHIVEVVNADCGPGTGRVELIKESQLEHTNLWRDYNQLILRFNFCPMCGVKLEVKKDGLMSWLSSIIKEWAELKREKKERGGAKS